MISKWKFMFILILLVAVSGLGWTEEIAKGLPETVVDVRYELCPVMGGKTMSDVTTLHGEKVYHFCCPMCIKKFEAEPEKYISNLKDPKEVELKVANIDGKCPAMGGTATTSSYKVLGDTITFLCCPSCGDKVKGPAKEEPKHEDHSGHKH